MQQLPTPGEIAEAEARRAAFVSDIPTAVSRAEDELPKTVRRMNAAARSKLQRIYQVADTLSAHREPFVACRKGCAACCHMNVTITAVEAERLARASGRRKASLVSTVHHAPTEFDGRPCPFLDGQGVCSVYEDRPLSCRKHASFFTSDIACRPPVMHQIEVPMLSFSGLDEALFALSGDKVPPLLADIRDFFPEVR
ncbi:MAG: YkgJ family cysteine cluster protein [Rubrivivax sp.]